MRLPELAERQTKICAVAIAAIALAACSSLPGISSVSAPTGDPGDNTFRNLISGNTARAVAGATPAQAGAVRVNCPIVQINDGGASYRTYVGNDRSSAGVRYQYSLGEVTRECVGTHAGQIEIRVGITGYVLAGPTGASGNFNVPVKVTIRNDNNAQVVSSKTYSIPTSIPQGETQSAFSAISDTVSVPILSENADEDYSIYVGFDNGQPAVPAKARPPRRRRG